MSQDAGTGSAGRQPAGRFTLPPDIVDVIAAEHARIRWLIASVDGELGPAGSGGVRYPAWEVLVSFIDLHIDAEEEIFYPPLSRVSPGVAATARQSRQADSDIRDAAGEARLSRPGSRAWRMAVRAVRAAALMHVDCLDPVLAGPFRERVTASTRQAMSYQWSVYMASRALDTRGPA